MSVTCREEKERTNRMEKENHSASCAVIVSKYALAMMMAFAVGMFVSLEQSKAL